VATPPFDQVTFAPCFAAFIANDWPTNVKIQVERGGKTFDVTTFARIPNGSNDVTTWTPLPATGLPKDQVAVLFLSADPAASFHAKSSDDSGAPIEMDFPQHCPITPAVDAATQVGDPDPTAKQGQSGIGDAFHVVTDFPVSAYDILPFGGSTSFAPGAELVLPTSAWGTNYLMAGAPGGVAMVMATEDDTTITVSPKGGTILGTDADGGLLMGWKGLDGTLPSFEEGKVGTFKLNRGQYAQFNNGYPNWFSVWKEMSGSVLKSDKPIAVFSANIEQYGKTKTNLDYPAAPNSTGGAYDSVHEQVAPISALGSEYAVVPHATRRADLLPESVAYRFVGVADGTTLSYDPPIDGAPATLDLGQVVDFETDRTFVVTSQDDKHPFYVGEGMSGCWVTSLSRPGITPSEPWYKFLEPMYSGVNPDWYKMTLGDPDYVHVLPPAQFLTHYAFLSDPTFGTTNLVVTRVKTASGFHDVTIDCLGTIGGWKDVGTSGKYQTTNVDLVRAAVGNGTCTNGRQAAHSDGPFGIVVWGLDYYASYAYPAGGNVTTLNDLVVEPKPR